MALDVPQVARYWYDELAVTQPHTDDDPDSTALMILLGALGWALGPLPGIVRDTDQGPGYSALLDPTRAPESALPWLAQFAGVSFPADLPEDQKRARISDPPPFERGTLAAMRAAGAATMANGAQPRIIERNGSAYGIAVICRTADTPSPAATEAAVRYQKPAGLILTFIVSNAPIIDEGTRTIDAGTATIDTATLADIT